MESQRQTIAPTLGGYDNRCGVNGFKENSSGTSHDGYHLPSSSGSDLSAHFLGAGSLC